MSAITDRLAATLAEREGNYDDPLPNFKRISLFDAALAEMPEGPEKVAMRNIGQKLGRLIFQLTHPTDIKAIDDSWLDIAGYATCGLQISRQLRENPSEGTDASSS